MIKKYSILCATLLLAATTYSMDKTAALQAAQAALTQFTPQALKEAADQIPAAFPVIKENLNKLSTLAAQGESAESKELVNKTKKLIEARMKAAQQIPAQAQKLNAPASQEDITMLLAAQSALNQFTPQALQEAAPKISNTFPGIKKNMNELALLAQKGQLQEAQKLLNATQNLVQQRLKERGITNVPAKQPAPPVPARTDLNPPPVPPRTDLSSVMPPPVPPRTDIVSETPASVLSSTDMQPLGASMQPAFAQPITPGGQLNAGIGTGAKPVFSAADQARLDKLEIELRKLSQKSQALLLQLSLLKPDQSELIAKFTADKQATDNRIQELLQVIEPLRAALDTVKGVASKGLIPTEKERWDAMSVKDLQAERAKIDERVQEAIATGANADTIKQHQFDLNYITKRLQALTLPTTNANTMPSAAPKSLLKPSKEKEWSTTTDIEALKQEFKTVSTALVKAGLTHNDALIEQLTVDSDYLAKRIADLEKAQGISSAQEPEWI